MRTQKQHRRNSPRHRPSRLRRFGRAVRRGAELLVLASLAAVLWLLTPSGGRWLAPQLDRILGRTVGITLGLEGLDLALPGSLTCDRLHLRIRGESFMTATHVALSINLPALLKKTVRVTRVRADAASLVPTIPETVDLFSRPDQAPAPSHDPAKLVAIGAQHFDKDKTDEEASSGRAALVHASSGIMEWVQMVPDLARSVAFSPDGKTCFVKFDSESYGLWCGIVIYTVFLA